MPTGDQLVVLNQKQRLGLAELKDKLFDYLDGLSQDVVAAMWNADGWYTLPSFSYPAANQFTVSSGHRGTDGQGRLLDTGETYSYDAAVPFENTAATNYHVGFMSARVPDVLKNSRISAVPQYVSEREVVGVEGDPDAVVDTGGGTVELTVDTICEAGMSFAGRQVTVYLKTPESDQLATAIETLTVVWDGSNNKITTTGALGQSTISTTASDYTVVLLGPRVSASSLAATAGVLYLGYVVGNGATPTTSDTSGSTTFIPWPDIPGLIEERQLDWLFSTHVQSGGVCTDGGGLDVDITAMVGISQSLKYDAAGTTLTLVSGVAVAGSAPVYVAYDFSTETFVEETTYTGDTATKVFLAQVVTDGAGNIDSVLDIRRPVTALDMQTDICVGLTTAPTSPAHFVTIADACNAIAVWKTGSGIWDWLENVTIRIVGYCEETEQIVIPTDGMKFVGVKTDPSESDSSSCRIFWGFTDHLFDLNGKSGLVFRDLDIKRPAGPSSGTGNPERCAFFDDTASGTTMTDLHWENVRVDGADGFLYVNEGTGADAAEIENWTFDRCYGVDLGTCGVVIYTPNPTANSRSGIFFRNCTFKKLDSAAMWTNHDSGIEIWDADNVVIEGCLLEGGGSTGSWNSVIELSFLNNVTIAGTTAVGEQSDEVLLIGVCTDVSASNCTFVGGGVSGSSPGSLDEATVALTGSPGASFTGCLLRDCSWNGFYINATSDDCAVVGCTFESVAMSLIKTASGTSGTVFGTSVSRSSGTGLATPAVNVGTESAVNGNVIDVSSSSHLLVSAGDNSTVGGNVDANAAGSGITAGANSTIFGNATNGGTMTGGTGSQVGLNV